MWPQFQQMFSFLFLVVFVFVRCQIDFYQRKIWNNFENLLIYEAMRVNLHAFIRISVPFCLFSRIFGDFIATLNKFSFCNFLSLSVKITMIWHKMYYLLLVWFCDYREYRDLFELIQFVWIVSGPRESWFQCFSIILLSRII